MLQDIEGLSGYVTTRVAARMLGVTELVMQRRIQRGTVPALRLGRTLLVRLSDARLSQPDLRLTGRD